MGRIIGIAGKMGSGKDTAAEVMASFGFERMAFADALKNEVAQWLQSWHEPPEGCPVARDEIKDLDPYQKPTQPAMRTLLQWWGTDYRRAQDKDYWVKKMLYRMDPDKSYAIPDVRFANEAQMIRALGGQVWLIDREPQEATGIVGHPSEALSFSPDLIIPNRDDLIRFRNLIWALTAWATLPVEGKLTPPGVIRDTARSCGKVR